MGARLEVTVSTVPICGALDPCPKISAGTKAEFAFSLRDIEPPRLSEKIDTAPIQRWIDPKRLKEQLAEKTGYVNWGNGKAQPRRPNTERLRNHPDQLIERRRFAAGQDINLTDGLFSGAAEQNSIYEVIDVDHLVNNLTGA